MKKILLSLSLFLMVAALHSATLVEFPIQSFFNGAGYARSLTVTAVNPWLTDGSNLFTGSFTVITRTGNTNPQVWLQPNAYLLAAADTRVPLRFSVPPTNVVMNVLALLTTNSPVLSWYQVNLWTGTNFQTVYTTNFFNVTNTTLLWQTNITSVVSNSVTLYFTNYAWAFYQAFTNTTLETNFVTVNLTNSVNLTNTLNLTNSITVNQTNAVTVNLTNNFNVTNGISGNGFTGTITNFWSDYEPAATNLVGIIVTNSDAFLNGYYVSTNGDSSGEFGNGAVIKYLSVGISPTAYLQQENDRGAVFNWTLGTNYHAGFTGGSQAYFNGTATGVQAIPPTNGWVSYVDFTNLPSFMPVYSVASNYVTHLNLSTFTNGVCVTNVFQ